MKFKQLKQSILVALLSLLDANKVTLELTFQNSTYPLTSPLETQHSEKATKKTDARYSCEKLARINENIVRHTEWIKLTQKDKKQVKRQNSLKKQLDFLNRELDRIPVSLKKKCRLKK